jgi:signal transduction histidine kinase
VDALRVVSVVLAAAWLVVALVTALRPRHERRSSVLYCAGLACAHCMAIWTPLAPFVPAAWLGYALSLPDGRLRTLWRRLLAGAAVVGSAALGTVLAATGNRQGGPLFLGLTLGVAVVGTCGVAVRYRSAAGRHRMQWIGAAGVLIAGYGMVCLALHAMTGDPQPLAAWLAVSLVLVPLAHLMSAVTGSDRITGWIVRESIGAAGVAVSLAAAYLVILVGIEDPPRGHERTVLVASLSAAVVGALLARPIRSWLIGLADGWINTAGPSTDEVVATFGARMSRAIPMDELLAQLAESLRATVAHGGAEIWTGTGASLTRTVSVPTRPTDRVELGERELSVVAHARIGGPHWTSMWLPDIGAGVADRADFRAVPIAHLGELHGLLVVRRLPDEPEYTEYDERALLTLAQQLALALRNIRLDSALQASLAELEQRNAELQASRLRIVTAADRSRREIERNLHDGAQQRLVALAVNLGLARQVGEDGDTAGVLAMLDELRGDVQSTIGELRELAHGIYPPLLRLRGLGEALSAAARRFPLPSTVDVELPDRYPEQVEATAYFCCLEVMQNATKHAGDGAALTLRVRGHDAALSLELVDDGVGFDMTTTAFGHGFVNMRDRVGAIGGKLQIESEPGKGTAVRARIPSTPRN